MMLVAAGPRRYNTHSRACTCARARAGSETVPHGRAKPLNGNGNDSGNGNVDGAEEWK